MTLVERLRLLDPADLWNLAPKSVLMHAAGLLSTGEPVAWGWTGQQLEAEFPLRLDTLVCRLRLNQQKLDAVCDCSKPQPCQHHIAVLMLVVHLLKDFNAFGRYPNRVLAEKLKLVLTAGSHGSQSAPPTPTLPPQKHLFLNPKAQQVISYRVSFAPNAENVVATAPSAVSSFTSAWTHTLEEEDRFWAWFTGPAKKLPVFIGLEPGPVEVKGKGRHDYDGRLLFDLVGDVITIRRRLFLDGQPVEGRWHEVGLGFVFLESSKALARVQPQCSWHRLPDLLKALTVNELGSRPKPLYTLEDRIVKVPRAAWNAAGISWSPHGCDFAVNGAPSLPQAATEAQPSINLVPSSPPGTLQVEVCVKQEDILLPGIQSLIPVERLVHSIYPDPSLLGSGQRSTEVMGAIYRCWLCQEPHEAAAILEDIRQSNSFKNLHQRRAAANIVDEIGVSPAWQQEPPDTSVLLVLSSGQWALARDGIQQAAIATALVHEVLGASYGCHWREYFPASPLIAEFSVQGATALQHLEKLMLACQARGIRLTYASNLISLSKLSLSVRALTGKKIDFFELKPEVRSGQELIPQERWDQIINTGVYLDENGTLRVIDIESISALARVKRVIAVQAGEADDEQELLQIPRLRILDWLSLRKHGVHCDIPQEDQALLESLLQFDQLQREPLPSVKATLRPYQHDGYSWLAFLYRHGFGACLADDMGLGKTLQTITLLAAIKEGIVQPLSQTDGKPRPHLLVLPPTLLFNWQSEIRTFYPSLYVHPYTGKGRSLTGIREGVVLTTYDLVRRDIDLLKNKEFDCIIFDEAQAVKNALGERARAMRQLNGRFKLCLTGTPLENHAGEYFSIIDLALPGLLGDRKDFLSSLRNDAGVFDILDRAKPFVLRRTKEKILKELPPKIESDIHLELTEEQKQYYTRAVGEVRQEVLAAYKDKTAQQAGIVALAALTRLRQICVSPALLDPNNTECSPKIGYLCGQLEEIVSEGHAALVFSQFTRALDHLEHHLRDTGIAFQRLDGSTPTDNRRKLVENFQKQTGPAVFLISLRAGGAGLNLTRASYVFHLDPWWNPAVENQASDRAHRMGQQNTVFIQRLLMLNTIEEKIMQLKVRKRALFDQVMQGTITSTEGTGTLMTKDDFKYLLEG
ncbi:MAG: DEAD/DEAH box helicase [Verrucomicrobiaceae bacterium]|nr:DEAD/DEAH box helicase [Verrucomicrobiaceae bacterium]